MMPTLTTRFSVGRTLRAGIRPRVCSLLALSGATLLAGCNENYYDIKNVHIPAQNDAATLPTAPAKTSPVPSTRPSSNAQPDAGPADAGPDASGTGTPPLDAGPDGATGSDTGIADAAPDATATAAPLEPGAPVVNGTPADQANFDMFAQIGNRYWFVVDPAQVDAMNNRYGGYYGGGGGFGDIYVPGEPVSNANYADHLLVTTASDGVTADYGKVQVRVVGQSTYLPWTLTQIPNLKLDVDEFVEDQRVGGFEHFRFNNAQVGNIFREKLTLDLFKKFNYPSLNSQHAWVGSSVWGEDVAVPYVMVESYKRPFCDAWEAELGGGCENMWEGVGDPFGSGYYYGGGGGGVNTAWFDNSDCQLGKCETTRVEELLTAVSGAFVDPTDFKAQLADYIDWPAFHKFQCVSWILDIGDDMFQNTNNVVIVERSDGKFQFLPWSVDISLQTWYGPVPLANRRSSLAQACQSDAQCWADTVAACDEAIATFKAADPVQMLDDEYAALADQGMLRPGDDTRYNDLRAYLTNRLTEIDVEIELNRDAPHYDNYYYNSCERMYGYDYVDCGGQCVLKVDCPVCGEEPVDGDGGVPDGGSVPASDAGSSVLDAAVDAAVVPGSDGAVPGLDAGAPSLGDAAPVLNIALPPPPSGSYGYYEPPPACWYPPEYPYYPYPEPVPMPMPIPFN
jgi:CotH kinase protein